MIYSMNIGSFLNWNMRRIDLHAVWTTSKNPNYITNMYAIVCSEKIGGSNVGFHYIKLSATGGWVSDIHFVPSSNNDFK
jgi:hypothetical protein